MWLFTSYNSGFTAWMMGVTPAARASVQFAYSMTSDDGVGAEASGTSGVSSPGYRAVTAGTRFFLQRLNVRCSAVFSLLSTLKGGALGFAEAIAYGN